MASYVFLELPNCRQERQPLGLSMFSTKLESSRSLHMKTSRSQRNGG